MSTKIEKLLKEFDAKCSTFDMCGHSLTGLLTSLLEASGIKPHSISYRIKTRKSLEGKIIRKEYKYENLSDITDLVGIRIITLFEDDIDKVAKIIEDEFTLDFNNCVDKRKIENDKFGYSSLHYVFTLSSNRTKLREYSSFKGINAEVQIRSILQHSWAEIEHDLGYKGENTIPQSAKRTFYRVAALLEQADIEFSKLRTQLMKREAELIVEIKDKPDKVELDFASILSFLKNSERIHSTEQHCETLNVKFSSQKDYTDAANTAINFLQKLKISNIADLDRLYQDNQKTIIQYGLELSKLRPGANFVNGASLLWLIKFLKGETVPKKPEKANQKKQTTV